jgi:peptide/nickel transport system permease protein
VRVLRFLIHQNRIGLVGGIIIVVFVIMALIPGLIAPHDPIEMFPTDRLAPPSPEFPAGTDRYGRDIMSRIAFGTRVSFQVGIISVLVAAGVGTLLGLTAGYFRGPADYWIMRIMDTIFSFPSILLAIAMVAILGSGLLSMVLAIGIVFTPTFARVARAPTLSVKEQEYVAAAITVGVPTVRVLFRHILPNVMAPIMVQMALSLSGAVVVEAALSFLGLGAVPPTPSLGSMLSEGRTYMEVAPWTVLFPGLALGLMVLGINLFGDAVRDLLDPRQHSEL